MKMLKNEEAFEVRKADEGEKYNPINLYQLMIN